MVHRRVESHALAPVWLSRNETRLLHKPKIVSAHEIQNSPVDSDAIVRCIGLRCDPDSLAEGPLPFERMKAMSSKASYRFRLGHCLTAQRPG